MFHNESLAAIDALIAPVIEALAAAAVPAAPQEGHAGLLATLPLARGGAGAGAGLLDERRLAVPGPDAAHGRDGARGRTSRRKDRDGLAACELVASKLTIGGKQVVRLRDEIADVSGGATIDTEARMEIAEMLASLRANGLIS